MCIKGTLITVACMTAAIVSGQTGATSSAATKLPDAPTSAASKRFEEGVIIAPNINWTTGTQQQTILGGSALLSAVRSASYCDPTLLQFGLGASASDSSTKKLGGTPTYLDSNDVRLDATRGIFGRTDNAGHSETRSYLGADADFFGNNSLGIGLQQIYALKYQYYLTPCPSTTSDHRWFASFGVGPAFLHQRLYATADGVNAAALPLTLQLSYLMGAVKGKPPKLIWYALLGYLPVLTDTHAYQLSGIASVQIPTRIRWLTVSLSDSDLYMNNAPAGHRRNYQNGAVSLVFSLPRKLEPAPGPPPAASDLGACYGGDKLQRLYCYDQVTSDSCAAPSMFRRNQRCSSAGIVTVQ